MKGGRGAGSCPVEKLVWVGGGFFFLERKFVCAFFLERIYVPL